MPEPITVGSLVAEALAAGAVEVGKGVAKDAYEALKSAASRALGPSVAHLEAMPDSAHRAGVVAELVDKQPEPVQAELHELADALCRALEEAGRGATLTTMFNQFNAYGGQQSNAPGGTQNFGTPPPKPEAEE